jgi:hypothetical protein
MRAIWRGCEVLLDYTIPVNDLDLFVCTTSSGEQPVPICLTGNGQTSTTSLPVLKHYQNTPTKTSKICRQKSCYIDTLVRSNGAIRDPTRTA